MIIQIPKRKLNPRNCTFEFRRVSSKEIKDVMKILNRKKAQGYDEIPTSFIKDGADILAEPLTTLINRCLKNPSFHQKKNARKLHQYTSLTKDQFWTTIGPFPSCRCFPKCLSVWSPDNYMHILKKIISFQKSIWLSNQIIDSACSDKIF